MPYRANYPSNYDIERTMCVIYDNRCARYAQYLKHVCVTRDIDKNRSRYMCYTLTKQIFVNDVIVLILLLYQFYTLHFVIFISYMHFRKK